MTEIAAKLLINTKRLWYDATTVIITRDFKLYFRRGNNRKVSITNSIVLNTVHMLSLLFSKWVIDNNIKRKDRV